MDDNGNDTLDLPADSKAVRPARCRTLVARLGETRCELVKGHPGPCDAPMRIELLRHDPSKPYRPEQT